MVIKVWDNEKLEITVKGQVIDHHSYSIGNRINIRIDYSEFKKIEDLKLKDIPESVSDITVYYCVFAKEIIPVIEAPEINLVLKSFWEKNLPKIIIESQVETEKWEKPFSLIRLTEKLREIASNKNVEYHQEDERFVSNGFGIKYPFEKNDDTTIGQVFRESIDVFRELINNAEASLIEESNIDKLATFFEFPEEIRAICEQYLIYFSTFLRDLGVEATVEIQENKQRTFFFCTPIDKNEGLKRIKDALDIYLNLPGQSNLPQTPGDFNDVSVVQLVSTIYHFKSQILLLESVVQNKNATIEALSIANFQYRQLIETNKKNEPKGEELFGGLVTVTEYESKGFKIDLPKLFKMLKRKWRKR